MGNNATDYPLTYLMSLPVTERNEKVPIHSGYTAGMASVDDANVVDHQPANAMPYNDSLNAFRFGPIRFAA